MHLFQEFKVGLTLKNQSIHSINQYGDSYTNGGNSWIHLSKLIDPWFENWKNIAKKKKKSNKIFSSY